MSYHVFVRNWWRRNPNWPNGLEPDPRARKTTLTYVDTEEEARQYCREYLETNPPGKLSRKAEYERVLK